MNACTYLDASFPTADLECVTKPKLVFRAYLDKGPGFEEVLSWYFGRSECKKWDVLWLKTNWDEESGKVAICCAPRNTKRGSTPWKDLLRLYWETEKLTNDCDDPNFSEIQITRSSLMSPQEVQQIADEIWPNE